jgi:hypothetical protein
MKGNRIEKGLEISATVTSSKFSYEDFSNTFPPQQVLVSCFLRPFKMAASSKRPPCSHEDVNSIFLNSETVLFLHQIFLKGLTSRLESWTTLVLGKTISMYTKVNISMSQVFYVCDEFSTKHFVNIQIGLFW